MLSIRLFKPYLAIALLTLSASLAVASSQEDSIDFEMTPGDQPPAGAQVIGGRRPQNPLDWPASFKLKVGTELCSATVIGPTTVATAAHCISDGARGRISFGGTSIQITCNHADKYSTNHNYDIALCQAAASIELPHAQGALPSQYERLALDATPVARHAPVLIQGYGCRVAGGFAGVLYVGDATVSRSANSLPFFKTKGAAVCSGDSGGGAFFRPDSTHRSIVGINARGNLADTSFITALSDPDVQAFILSWVEKKHAQICGINLLTAKCHD